MGRRILYILCHDDASEEKARSDFAGYNWARIHRIRTQTHLLESGMYQHELLSMYDEWKDADFVGTLSYKLLDRMPYYAHITTFQRIVQQIETTSSNEWDVVGFIASKAAGLWDQLPHLRKITYDTIDACHMNLRSYSKYDIRTRTMIPQYIVEPYIHTFMFHNYWMARPSWMLKYIQFFNQVWLPALEKHPLVWYDSMYNSGLPKERLLTLSNGRADYHPYHAYVNEFLPTLYFTHANARVLT